jgi:benzylsuccinate CoA-transferase BbsF subunit
MSGMSSLIGYPGSNPMNHGVMYPDPVAGMMGACAVLIAIHHLQKTGEGQFIDFSQQETASLLLGSSLMDYSMNKRVRTRQGNRHDFMAPHQYFRCRGDQWIAISVSSDEEWRRLVQMMGMPEWAEDRRFENTLGRLENEDELNRYIEGWTVTQNRDELAQQLQLSGVAAGPVLPFHEVMNNVHLKARDYIQQIDYGVSGSYATPGLTWKMSMTPGYLQRIAPDLGQDSEGVLNRLLGITHEEYERLVQKGVTGQEPIL